jgi:hypothetical protein
MNGTFRGLLLGAASLAMLALLGNAAQAQAQGSVVLTACGTAGYSAAIGQTRAPTQDTNGKGCGTDPVGIKGADGSTIVSVGNPLPVNASVSASVAGFTMNSATPVNMSVTNATSRVALPTGAVVLVQNDGTKEAYVNLGDGTVTSTTNYIGVPAQGGCALTVGANVDLAAITAGSDTTTLKINGGTGLAQTCYGGGSSSGGGGGAVTVADGADVTQGAKADAKSTATDSTPITVMQVLKQISASVQAPPSQAVTNAGTFAVQSTAQASSAVMGHVIADTGSTTAVTQATAANLNATVAQSTGSNLHMVVDSATGVAQGSTTSGQTLSPIGCRTLTSAPTDTTAQTNMPWCRVNGTQATDTASINGTTVSTGTGAQGAGAQRVTVATDSATVAGSASLPAGSNVIGHVIADTGSTTAATQATGTNLHTVTDSTSVSQAIPGTSGGLSFATITAANSTNATNLKASAGQLYHITGYSAAAVPTWISFYNTAGTPSCGTSIVYQMLIPVNSTSGGGAVDDIPSGLAFSTGIGYCITTGIAGTGSVAATSIVANFGYK